MTGRRFEVEKESTNERVGSVCTGLADLGVYSPPPLSLCPTPCFHRKEVHMCKGVASRSVLHQAGHLSKTDICPALKVTNWLGNLNSIIGSKLDSGRV